MSLVSGKTSSARRLVLAMCLAEMLSMVGIFAFPTLLPRFFEIWRLTNTEAGWINGIYFAGYTVAVPVLGSLTDRIDARRIYLIFAGVGIVSALGFAWLADGFWTALVFRALAGLGLAGTFIPGLKALVDRLDGPAQTRGVSFYTATFGLGTSLSFFATGQIDAWLGWRWAFAVGALGSAGALILAMLALKPHPPVAENRAAPKLLDFRPVFRNRQTMAYILAYVVHMWELFAFRSWMVAFLTFSLTLQPEQGNHLAPASVAALVALIAMWASVGGAELALRYGRRRTLTLIMGSSTIFAFGIGFSAELPYFVVVLLLILYGLLVQGDSAALYAGVLETSAPGQRGTSLAVQSLLGFASAFIGPIVIGIVLDATGSGQTIGSWVAAFIAMGAVVAAGPIFLAAVSDRTRWATDSRPT